MSGAVATSPAIGAWFRRHLPCHGSPPVPYDPPNKSRRARRHVGRPAADCIELHAIGCAGLAFPIPLAKFRATITRCAQQHQHGIKFSEFPVLRKRPESNHLYHIL